MKLPHDAAAAAFNIGERKFALFLSFAFVEVEDHDLQSGIMFRPGEVSCVTHTPDGEEPFDLVTAHLQPAIIEADNVEDAALAVSKQILTVGDRIIERQKTAGEPQPDAPADETA